ncbi:element excision factor XisI family protein [Microcoleus sp. D3_18_C4]|uniref:element excision factor XisI family protein n=1 Tax=Microcoleus sp. D3_18_C4 TaxID=3055335 RepID=UPI002FD59F86
MYHRCRIIISRLIDYKVVIEEDNFEKGLSQELIAAAIKAEDIVTSSFPDNSDRQKTYQAV